VFRCATSGNDPVRILDADQLGPMCWKLQEGDIMQFTINVFARSSTNRYKSWVIMGLASCPSGPDSVTIENVIVEPMFGSNMSDPVLDVWDAQPIVDSIKGGICLEVQGAVGSMIDWKCIFESSSW
jgi:hypothetical protein